jgi:GH24 family phage-related lysozyme (muramidase)
MAAAIVCACLACGVRYFSRVCISRKIRKGRGGQYRDQQYRNQKLNQCKGIFSRRIESVSLFCWGMGYKPDPNNYTDML